MRSARRLAATAVATLALAACGGAAPTTDDAGVGGDELELPDPAPSPPTGVEVTPEAAAASPLPEVAVRRVNGEGGWVQLRNELPADRPLLVWFWAPH